MPERQRSGSRARFREYLKKAWAKSSGGKASVGDVAAASASRRSLGRMLKELLLLLKGMKGDLALSLALLSLGTAIKLFPPAVTKLLIDGVLVVRPGTTRPGIGDWRLPSDPKTSLILLAVATFVVSVLGASIHLWSRRLATQTSKRLQLSFRRKVFDHAVRLPLHRVYQLKSGGASSLLREDAGGVGELIFSMLYNPWRAIIEFAGGFIVLAWVDWRLLIGALCLGPAVYWTHRSWERRIRPLHKDVRAKRQEIDSSTTEAFGGMRVVRAFGRQRRESSRFVVENHLMARQELYVWWCSRTVEIIWDLILPLASGALLLYGGLQVIDGRLSLGDLMMFLVYLAMLLEPLAVIATSVTQFQNNLAGFERALDLLAEPREMRDSPGRIAIKKPATEGRITLRDASFRYPGSEKLVVRNVTLDVRPGETIAFVGRSGSGKTTLCNLIARFYDPTSGVVELDGMNLREIEVESYRRLLGIVEQDVFLFDGTVAENVAYAARHATQPDVVRAARAANAAEFIEALPNGYETVIGERGVRLSGGQRQRLAIARAVLADPKIFILDEATSNLDTESERLIQQSLATLLRNRTSFIIAHRLSTIRDADRIVVLDDGATIEVGSHSELIAKSGFYRNMIELQQIDEDA